MKDVINGHKIEIDCKKCGAKMSATVGQLRRSPTLRCRNGHATRIEASQLDTGLRPLDRSMADLDRTLRNFGK